MSDETERWLYSPRFAGAVADALANEGIVLSPERWAVFVETIRREKNV